MADRISVRMTLAAQIYGGPSIESNKQLRESGRRRYGRRPDLAVGRNSRTLIKSQVGGVQDRERKRKQAEVEVRGVAEEGSYERWRRRWRAEVSIATPVGKRQRKWVRHRQIGELGIGAVGGREDDSNIEDDGENGLEGRPISGKQEQGITTPLVAKKTDKRGGVIVNTGELSKKVKSVSFNGTPIRTVLLRNMVDWLYYPAFLLVVAGIFLYSKINHINGDDIVHNGEKGPERSPAIEDTNFDSEYQHLIGEENSSPVK
ncbi:DNA-damage-repair/toleration protein DRT111 [Striga asiatica]|uniref:DNA-damage-repair/toleration protein DRT111 n=1 Tax=Striga asiatica TaxID=4170 RepID=A0A5A7Q499_STRAF|nr:DNA-damage-repair/toleration protein DRT111 [Striga asiatica]